MNMKILLSLSEFRCNARCTVYGFWFKFSFLLMLSQLLRQLFYGLCKRNAAKCFECASDVNEFIQKLLYYEQQLSRLQTDATHL